MASIDDTTKERTMIIIELGKKDEDLNLLLDFMSKKEHRPPSEHRQAAIMCFKTEFEPNYDKQYYDFEVKVGSPS